MWKHLTRSWCHPHIHVFVFQSASLKTDQENMKVMSLMFAVLFKSLDTVPSCLLLFSQCSSVTGAEGKQLVIVPTEIFMNHYFRSTWAATMEPNLKGCDSFNVLYFLLSSNPTKRPKPTVNLLTKITQFMKTHTHVLLPQIVTTAPNVNPLLKIVPN